MTTSGLTRVLTKRVIVPKAPTPGLDVQYPCDWFSAHPGDKPLLNITLTSANLTAARQSIRKGISDNAIDLDSAKTFLYFYARETKAQLTERWESYGRVIGLPDEVVTPLSLVTVRSNTVQRESMGSVAVTPEDDAWMAGYVLSIYRLIRATVGEYKAQIAARVSTQLKSIHARSPDVTDIVDMYRGWVNDKSYNTLVASYDMFFNRFPLHPYSNMRIGTTGSRFRDCAALISYGYLTNLLGMGKATDLMDWVFVDQVGNDIDRLMGSDDELLDPYSYFPYHVDMGLVSKSAYSATANPHFFEWVHTTGALMRSQRSLNARHICDARSSDILANAACLAYAYANTFTFTKVYTEDGTELELEDDEDDDEQGDDPTKQVLKSKDPSSWCILMKSRGGTLPSEVKKYVNKIVSGIQEAREGTIDHHLTVAGRTFA